MTAALTYNPRNQLAQRTLDYIQSLGVFTITPLPVVRTRLIVARISSAKRPLISTPLFAPKPNIIVLVICSFASSFAKLQQKNDICKFLKHF